MWEILQRFPRAYLWSILLHLVLLVLMVVGLDWRVQNDRVGAFEQMIQAQMGQSSEIAERIAALQADSAPAPEAPAPLPEPEPLPEPAPELEPLEPELLQEPEPEISQAQRRAEAAARREAERQAELERQREAEEAARREAEREAEQERQRQAEAEARRRAEEAAQREAERQAELERQREAEEEARREAERQAELERQREAEEAARRQAERQAELEREREELRRQREAEQAQARERQMLEALEAEERAQRQGDGDTGRASARQGAASAAEITNRWAPLITNQVRQYWVRPQGQRQDLETTVNLQLEPGGAVIPGSVRVVESSGKAAFDQSVVAAIYRASPLPVPEGDEFELFRDFNLVFRP